MRILYLSSGGYEKTDPFFLQLKKNKYLIDRVCLPTIKKYGFIIKTIKKAFYKLKYPIEYSYNKKIIELSNKNLYDLVIVVKGIFIQNRTLKILSKTQNCSIINWSPDNMYLSHNHNYHYKKNIGLYDIVYTTKIKNIEGLELETLGAKKVNFVMQCYSEIYHKPYRNLPKKYDVCFIGSYELERAEYIRYLAKKDIKVTVFGNGWAKNRFDTKISDRIDLKHKPLLDEKYSKAIAQTKICLCFLRKINCDTHTARSVEIPAIGTFMLAQRTKEHTEMFEEDLEACFFSSKEELYEKIIFHLTNQAPREKIAKKGYKKCINGKYAFQDLINSILKDVKELR